MASNQVSKPAAAAAGAVGLGVFALAPASLFFPMLPIAAGVWAGMKMYEMLTGKNVG
jgi:hypothetical protein